MNISDSGPLTNEELAAIQRRLSETRKATGNADMRWDINLSEGLVGEEVAKRIFEGNLTVEVKSDFLVHQHGNVAVEYAYKGKPSGISASLAKYYMFWFAGRYYRNELSILISTERLKPLAREYLLRHRDGAKLPSGQPIVVRGGNNGDSELILLPKNELLRV